MTFTPSIFLFPYILFLLLWLFFSIAAIYHMLKFGFKNLVTLLATCVFIGISIFILAGSLFFVLQIDWNTEVTVFGNVLESNRPFYEY